MSKKPYMILPIWWVEINFLLQKALVLLFVMQGPQACVHQEICSGGSLFEKKRSNKSPFSGSCVSMVHSECLPNFPNMCPKIISWSSLCLRRRSEVLLAFYLPSMLLREAELPRLCVRHRLHGLGRGQRTQEYRSSVTIGRMMSPFPSNERGGEHALKQV